MHKVGIIGAGVITDFHAQALQSMANTELVAAFARNQGKADSFSQKYGCTGYSDLNAFSGSSGDEDSHHWISEWSSFGACVRGCASR